MKKLAAKKAKAARRNRLKIKLEMPKKCKIEKYAKAWNAMYEKTIPKRTPMINIVAFIY
jgi:hypothetical protein